jgi:hypothetical protein
VQTTAVFGVGKGFRGEGVEVMNANRAVNWMAIAAIMFGVGTVLTGGRALFGSLESRAEFGNAFPFVLWFHFLAGFVYIVAGAGLRGDPGVRPEDLVGRAEHLVPGQGAGSGDSRVRRRGRPLLRPGVYSRDSHPWGDTKRRSHSMMPRRGK